MLKSLFKSD